MTTTTQSGTAQTQGHPRGKFVIDVAALVMSILALTVSYSQWQLAQKANDRAATQSARQVLLVESPATIRTNQSTAAWSVWNQSDQPISKIWAEAEYNGGRIAWKLGGEIDRCSMRGIESSDKVVPQYLHYTADGQAWVRRNWLAGGGSAAENEPREDHDPMPQSVTQMPDKSAGVYQMTC